VRVLNRVRRRDAHGFAKLLDCRLDEGMDLVGRQAIGATSPEEEGPKHALCREVQANLSDAQGEVASLRLIQIKQGVLFG
jgi:hypothetical protein